MTRSDDPRPPTPSGAAGGPAGTRDGWFDTELPYVSPESTTGDRLRSVAGAACALSTRPLPDGPAAPGDGWFDPGLPAAPNEFPTEGPHPFLARALAERASRAFTTTDQNSREP